ncbi:hypothetical protein [Aquimarina brevivitae]|nr:hypothetical protein [Aquimarina brevivitae]
MKTLLFILGLLTMNCAIANASIENTNGGKEDKKKTEAKKAENKNFHSVRKWKITIEYDNGDKLSKTISVHQNATVSALDLAFAEAEKQVKRLKNVKGYAVKPVANNDYVLLATNK